MKLKKILALTLALAIAATSFAGCSSSSTDTSTDADTTVDTSTEEEDKGATELEDTTVELGTDAYPGTVGENSLVVNLGAEPPELNTLTATYGIAFTIMRHTMENLVMLDENDNPIPGVAESWDISDDGLNYTFYLREGMEWTNGEPVTANDFVFAWEQVLTPANAADYAYFAYMFKNGEAFYNGEVGIEEVGFKAVDDYTIEVTLENPTAYALFLFSFGTLLPINETFFNEVGVEKYCTDVEYFCTNGAFTITEWVHDSHITMEKDEDFYLADDISLDELTFMMITDDATALTAFQAGELDVVDVAADQLTLMENEGYPISTYGPGYEYHLLFNTDTEFLSNVNIRRALDLAYDREDYIEYVLQDASIPAISFTYPSVSNWDASGTFAATVEETYGALKSTKADAELAQEYLAIGIEELGCTIEDVAAGLDIACSDTSTAQAQAAFLQEQFRVNLGLEITVTPMTTAALSAERTARNYTIHIAGWGPDYNDPMTFLDLWVTDGGNNSTEWSNERYDELITLAAQETDLELRESYFLECEEIIASEVPISSTYWMMTSYVISGKLTGGYWRTTFQDMNYKFATVA